MKMPQRVVESHIMPQRGKDVQVSIQGGTTRRTEYSVQEVHSAPVPAPRWPCSKAMGRSRDRRGTGSSQQCPQWECVALSTETPLLYAVRKAILLWIRIDEAANRPGGRKRRPRRLADRSHSVSSIETHIMRICVLSRSASVD